MKSKLALDDKSPVHSVTIASNRKPLQIPEKINRMQPNPIKIAVTFIATACNLSSLRGRWRISLPGPESCGSGVFEHLLQLTKTQRTTAPQPCPHPVEGSPCCAVFIELLSCCFPLSLDVRYTVRGIEGNGSAVLLGSQSANTRKSSRNHLSVAYRATASAWLAKEHCWCSIDIRRR
jgi:hypothetical protein